MILNVFNTTRNRGKKDRLRRTTVTSHWYFCCVTHSQPSQPTVVHNLKVPIVTRTIGVTGLQKAWELLSNFVLVFIYMMAFNPEGNACNANRCRMLLKRRGTGSGKRVTEVWERVVSGNLHKNSKWRDDGRKMAERHWK